jgi:hypothetical protein
MPRRRFRRSVLKQIREAPNRLIECDFLVVLHLYVGSRRRFRMCGAAAGGSPVFHRSCEAAKQQSAPSAGSVNPNSRKGRLRPHLQGRDMDQIFIGIDVSKDRLDVHVRPAGTIFTTARDSAGLEQLVARVHALAPTLVVVEATGGFEVTAAARRRFRLAITPSSPANTPAPLTQRNPQAGEGARSRKAAGG